MISQTAQVYSAIKCKLPKGLFIHDTSKDMFFALRSFNTDKSSHRID